MKCSVTRILKTALLVLLSMSGGKMFQYCGVVDTAMQMEEDYWTGMEYSNDAWLDYIRM